MKTAKLKHGEQGEDVPLWDSADDKFQIEFYSKQTWKLLGILKDNDIEEWFKICYFKIPLPFVTKNKKNKNKNKIPLPHG